MYFFCFSNATQFDTVVPLIEELIARNERVVAFVNSLAEAYAAGLGEKIATRKELFAEILPIDLPNNAVVRFLAYLKIKRILKKKIDLYRPKAIITFTEGGSVEWLFLGVAREKGIKAITIQWAIVWEPYIYDAMHKRKPRLAEKAIGRKRFILSLFGLNYPRMKYYGDGNAERILTMGDFWTQQFKKVHPQLKEKFVTFGVPRFAKYRPQSEKEGYALFTSGAGAFLYDYKKEDHLSEIRDIYEAARKAGMRLLHKPHPRDPVKNDIDALAAQYQNVSVTFENLDRLLPSANCLLTIRSTTGFEALLCGTPVIVYETGKQSIGFDYAAHGLASKAKSVVELVNLLVNEPFMPSQDQVASYVQTRSWFDVFQQASN